MATLIAAGNTTASSSDFIIAAGGSTIVRLFGSASGPIPGDALVFVEYKVGAVYVPYPPAELNAKQTATIIDGDPLAATTWRVTRNPNGSSNSVYGVDQA